MPVNETHRQYNIHRAQWERCRDTIAGSDAIKRKGTEYLPKLDGQDSNEYEAYKKRANFYGATRRTIGGLLGSVMRRRPEVAFPDEGYLESVTIDGRRAYWYMQLSSSNEPQKLHAMVPYEAVTWIIMYYVSSGSQPESIMRHTVKSFRLTSKQEFYKR